MVKQTNEVEMDQRLKESISALMDDEANELEVQRVLSRLHDKEVCETWQSFHVVRDVIRTGDQTLSASKSNVPDIDVSASVAAALEQVEQGSVTTSRQASLKGQKQWRWAGSGAVAASLLLAVFYVSNKPHYSEEHLAAAPTAAPIVEPVIADKQPVIVGSLDDRQVQRLNEYLLRHAEHTLEAPGLAMVPLARVASVNAVGI